MTWLGLAWHEKCRLNSRAFVKCCAGEKSERKEGVSVCQIPNLDEMGTSDRLQLLPCEMEIDMDMETTREFARLRICPSLM